MKSHAWSVVLAEVPEVDYYSVRLDLNKVKHSIRAGIAFINTGFIERYIIVRLRFYPRQATDFLKINLFACFQRVGVLRFEN